MGNQRSLGNHLLIMSLLPAGQSCQFWGQKQSFNLHEDDSVRGWPCWEDASAESSTGGGGEGNKGSPNRFWKGMCFAWWLDPQVRL